MTIYLTVEQVIAIHDEMLRKFGGLSGIRDENLLHSAVNSPRATFGQRELYSSIYDKAAALVYHIARNHPFNDGNKRTSYMANLIFLKGNKIALNCKKTDLERLIIDIAKGKITKEQFAFFLEFGKIPQA